MSSLTHSIMNSAGIVNLMGDNLDATEAVILDYIMAILYVRWRGMAVKWEFQALTLAEGQEEIRAHEAQSQITLRGHGRPRVAKLPASMAEKVPMGMDCSPQNFKKRAKSEKWLRNH